VVNGFVIPALLGNIVGGVVLVALLNYAQVKRDKEVEQEKTDLTRHAHE
jgi:formate/nitrite transporter FocA (FNT family)